jgi:hypothetical protein
MVRTSFIIVVWANIALVLVGASLLAMDVNDESGFLNTRGALTFFASRLAPTVGVGQYYRRPSDNRLIKT